MKNRAYINWNNGPIGPFYTSSHPLIAKGEHVYTRILSRLYKIQVSAEGSFFIRKDGKKHPTVLLS